MVARSLWGNQRGKTGAGCLIGLVVLAAVAYYGAGAGASYLRYWQLKDEMRAQARFAPTLEDQVIRRRLVTKAQALKLPAEASRFVIRRLARPREVVITTSWQDIIELPFYSWVVQYKPEARALL